MSVTSLFFLFLLANPILSVVLTEFYFYLKFKTTTVRASKSLVLLVACSLSILFALYFFSYLLYINEHLLYATNFYLLGSLLGLFAVLFKVSYDYDNQDVSAITNEKENLERVYGLGTLTVTCSIFFWIAIIIPFVILGNSVIYTIKQKSSIKDMNNYLEEAKRTGDISLCDKIPTNSDGVESRGIQSKILCYESVDKEYPNYQKNCTLYDKHGYLEQATEQQVSCIAYKVKDFIDVENLSINCDRLNEYPEGLIYKGKERCEEIKIFLNNLKSVVNSKDSKLCKKFMDREQLLLTSGNVNSEPYYSLCVGYFVGSDDQKELCSLVVGDSHSRSGLLGQCETDQWDEKVRDFLITKRLLYINNVFSQNSQINVSR